MFLSRSLGFSVLAEFVETAEQAAQLAALGCVQYQGYLFSPAVTLAELKQRLEDAHAERQ